MTTLATRGRRRGWALLAITALAAVACGNSGGDSGDGAAPSRSDPGDVTDAAGDLPEAEFEMANGETAQFADFLDGKPLVVNFFASWCAPCRAEMPEFQAVHASVQNQVQFLGMALQDTKEDAAELVELTGVEYPWGLDQTGTIYGEFRGFGMPTTVFVSAEGEIVDKDNGAISEDVLRQRLENLFGVTAA